MKSEISNKTLSTNEIIKTIEDSCKTKKVNRHSYYQLKFFMIESEPTHDSKIWKCQDELNARKETIESLLLDIDDAKDQIIILQEEKKIFKNNESYSEEYINSNIRIKERKVKRLNSSIQSLENRIIGAAEEAIFILREYEILEKRQEARNFDDINAQREYWNAKLSEELNYRLLLKKPIETELAKTISNLDDDCQVKKSLNQLIISMRPNDKIENKSDN